MQDFFTAAGQSGINENQPISGKDVTVPLHSIDLVNSRYDLHDTITSLAEFIKSFTHFCRFLGGW